MAGLSALSINTGVYKGNFAQDLFLHTFYQQHLGEQFCGLSVWDSQKIKIRTHRGLLRANFEGNFSDMTGTEGIGYCGSDREPFRISARIGRFSVCFSGNIINHAELLRNFMDLGHTFERGDDIEIIAKIIARASNADEGIGDLANQIKGAYAILVLTEGGIYAAVSPNGQWPLIVGEKEGAIVVASECGGFHNLGFQKSYDLKPGDIVFIKNGEWKKLTPQISNKIQICSFLWVYTTFPPAVIRGIPASLVRKRLGGALARRDIERGFIPDIVAPVPDSGRFHAIGYFQEFCQQVNEGRLRKLPYYDEVLLKYAYAGRSYTPQTQEERDKEAHIKLLKSGEDFIGKKVVVCDDSIVRGTQTQTNLVPKLRTMGIQEIHFRISNPELLSHCPWGKTTKKGETLASRLPKIEDRVEFLGVESLEYNTTDDLVQAIGLPSEQLCVDCSLPHRD